MATVTGYTAARMKQIEDSSVVKGTVTGDNLILTRRDGQTITAGNVRGPKGDTGNPGIAANHPSVDVGNSIIAGTDGFPYFNHNHPSLQGHVQSYLTTADRDNTIVSPKQGMVCTVAGVVQVYRAGAWENVATDFTGVIKMFVGTVAPSGWLLCDGAAIPAGTIYDSLRALVGNNTPNFTGRSPFGAGGSGVILKGIGGSQTHTLSEQEMPAHSHVINGVGDHRHGHPHAVAPAFTNPGIPISGGYAFGDFPTDAAGAHTHTMNNAGGNIAHNNMPPYYGVNFIIKV